ncbi:MAG: hypothetical protein LBC85_08970 [Fibromonadaceae bacterium]|jgi:uncharacterized protein (TIGR02145 family)|nr:hypothetical protein [Fibromonadaceae bacterium]
MNRVKPTLLAVIFITTALTFSCSLDDGNILSYGSLYDSRDGKTYKTVVVGSQTWMAENLNYEVSGSACYDNNPSNCVTYGRLYNWATAMGLASTCNSSSCASQVQSMQQGVCPVGWHLPNSAEWTALMNHVGSNAGTKLKANSNLWLSNGSGTDDFGFSALPGGRGGGGFVFVGNCGFWWSATEASGSLSTRNNEAGFRRMGNDLLGCMMETGNKGRLFSVRCLKN